MIRQLAVRQKIFIFLLMLFFWTINAQPVWAYKLPDVNDLGGIAGIDPLAVTVYSDGNISVAQWDESPSGWGDTDYISRYYDDAYWGSILFLAISGVTHVFHSDAFSDQLFAVPDQSSPLGSGHQTISQDETTITTTWELLSGLFFTQTVSYESGTTVVTKRFHIDNQTDQRVTGVRMLHGGAIAYTGDVFQPLTLCCVDRQSITVAHQDTFDPRQIHFAASADSAWTDWLAGEWTDVFHAVRQNDPDPMDLPATVIQPAVFIGWSTDELAPQAEWTGQTIEDFASRQPDLSPTPVISATPMPTPSPVPTVTPALTTTPEPTVTTVPPTVESSQTDPTETTENETNETSEQSGTQSPSETSEVVESDPVPKTGERGLTTDWVLALMIAALAVLAARRSRVRSGNR